MYQEVQRGEERTNRLMEESPLGFLKTQNPASHRLSEELAYVWYEFNEQLAKTPIIESIENGSVTREQYMALLLNMRQQVMEGGRWIALAAASMDIEYFIIRSALIRHAAEEHRDYQMIEKNYVALGGDPSTINSAQKNIGSEALSSYIFHRAGQKNPLDLFGAMFVIEGLGQQKALKWARRLKETLNLEDKQVSFLSYHGENDDAHFDKLRMILSMPFINDEVAASIVKMAKVTGRLYCLQLEELNHF